MAKKKRRRPTTSARSGQTAGGVTTATTKGRGPVVAPAVKPAPAEPGGPNRQVRKEEARRQREAIRRRMARWRFLRRAGIVTLAVVVVAGVGVYVALKPNPAKQAGCGGIQTIAPYNPASLDRAHITAQGQVKTPPALSTYRTQPPTSGPHDPSPWDAGVSTAPPSIYRTIHSLEHGAVIVWFAPGATGGELQKIESFYSQPANNDHMIVAPYNYPDQGAAGKLPAGKQMVMVAWHQMQQCDRLSLAAVKAFAAGYRVVVENGAIAPGYKGDAPEAGSAI